MSSKDAIPRRRVFNRPSRVSFLLEEHKKQEESLKQAIKKVSLATTGADRPKVRPAAFKGRANLKDVQLGGGPPVAL